VSDRSLLREEPHYDIRWDVDGTIGYHLPEHLLRSIDPIKVGCRVRTRSGDGTVVTIDDDLTLPCGVKLDNMMGVFYFAKADLSPYGDPQMRTYCYRSPYPLVLTPEDADITDLLGAVLNLSMTYGEHRRTYSTEVMQAVGAVVALAKRSLKEEA
jgi:hypothetical protein